MIPEGTVFWGVLVKQALLGFSAFAAGVLFYRAIFFELRRHRPFLAIGLIGVMIELILISEVVVRAPLINPDWRALLYLAALIATGVGFLGDVIRERKRMSYDRDWEDQGSRHDRRKASGEDNEYR